MAVTIVETRAEIRAITGGVDTRVGVHVAAALDPIGGLLGVREFPATTGGYGRLLGWLAGFGTVALAGIEGTGSYGAGLARHMAAGGVRVVEAVRPDRPDRRRQGRSGPLDAVSAARAPGLLALDGIGPAPRRCCSSRRETIPDGSAPRRPGRTCAASPRSPHHRGKSPAVGTAPGSHPATRACAERRTAEGKSKAEIIRCGRCAAPSPRSGAAGPVLGQQPRERDAQCQSHLRVGVIVGDRHLVLLADQD